MVVHSDFPGDVRVAREVAAASDAGFDVTVIALRRDCQPAHEQVAGADVHRLPVSHKRGASPLQLVVEYLAFTILATLQVTKLTLRRRFDVVQVHNPPDFLIVAALTPRLRGARVVFDVHDLSSDMFAMRFPSRAGGIATSILHAVERVATRSADLVVTVHEPYRAELVRRGVPERKTLVVLNSLVESLLPTPVPPPRQAPFRVVYHGTVTPHYGISLLVDALPALAARIADVRLEIYGEGDAVPALRAVAEAHGISPLLQLTGERLPHAEVLRRVAGASVGVIPNLPTPLNRFALSTKLFEYVLLGIPVVCADLPTLRAHFGEHEVAFFRAGDAESLAAELLDVAEDYEAALARARSARHRYDNSYRWDLQAATYVSALRVLRASGGRTGRASRRAR
jgi:glycosyltransferase involved in cell wall biosynthesis